MTPNSKFQAMVLCITTIVIVVLWKHFGDKFEFSDIVLILFGGLVSLATYRLLYKLFEFIFSYVRIVKKIILCKSYLEGTWVGFYIGLSGNVRYVKEEFRQDLNGLIIKGTSFNENKNEHAKWTSDIVRIDERTLKIKYMYIVTPLTEKATWYGIADFDMEKNNSCGFCSGIKGYTSDNHNGIRIKSIEMKISDKFNISDTEILKEAEKIYIKNKDIY